MIAISFQLFCVRASVSMWNPCSYSCIEIISTYAVVDPVIVYFLPLVKVCWSGVRCPGKYSGSLLRVHTGISQELEGPLAERGWKLRTTPGTQRVRLLESSVLFCNVAACMYISVSHVPQDSPSTSFLLYVHLQDWGENSWGERASRALVVCSEGGQLCYEATLYLQGHSNCFYQGRVEGHPEWRATFSTCFGLRWASCRSGNIPIHPAWCHCQPSTYC